MCEPFLAVEALRLQTSVSEHLDHLRVFCTYSEWKISTEKHPATIRTLAIFLEDQLALVVVVLILSSPTVLAALRSSSARRLPAPSTTPFPCSVALVSPRDAQRTA